MATDPCSQNQWNERSNWVDGCANANVVDRGMVAHTILVADAAPSTNSSCTLPTMSIMASSPPLFPCNIASNASRVAFWITQLPCTRPDDKEDVRVPTESTIMAMRRDARPGKRQRLYEDLLPGHSASAAGSSHPLDLSQYNAFSPPSSQVRSRVGTGATSPRRGTSPSRESIAMLKDASPPVITEPYDGAELPPASRDKVMAVMERLEPGQLEGWIPESLKVDTDK